ncbi:MAG: hypothetical protein H6R01_436 [Burkholderiaceae bacterium]|nr:hypothetical protein [Burkholderiaceae bacterium]
MPKTLIHRGISDVYLHEQGDKAIIQTVQDVSPVLERAKELHNRGQYRTGMGQRHVASIPIIVLDAWARQRGKNFADVMNDQELFSLFLSDPAHGYFIIDKSSV